MNQKIKIAGCVTLYNSDDNLNNVIKTYIKDLEKLYLIDNTPNRNISNKFCKNKKIQYIANNENLGVATALNICANLAIKEGYTFLLTMDQDSAFEKNELKKLIDYVKNNDMSNVGVLSPWHNTKRERPRPEEDIEEVIEVMTSGNILNLSIYKKIGGFLDDYFIDCVDVEYCMRLNKLGYKVLRLNYCNLNHELGDMKSYKIGKRIIYTLNHNHIRKYYITRNTLYLYEQYKDIFPEYSRYLKRGILSMLKKVILFEKNKLKKIRSVYRGYRDYCKNVTGKYSYKN